MIIWLPLALVFILNSGLLLQQQEPPLLRALGFFIIGSIFLLIYCRERENG